MEHQKQPIVARWSHRCLLWALCAGLCASSAAWSTEAAANGFASRAGQKIADFRLHDFRGKEHALSEFKDRKLVAVAFLGTDCPLAKLYAPRLAELAAEFEKQGVAFVGIDSNSQDSLTDI